MDLPARKGLQIVLCPDRERRTLEEPNRAYFLCTKDAALRRKDKSTWLALRKHLSDNGYGLMSQRKDGVPP